MCHGSTLTHTQSPHQATSPRDLCPARGLVWGWPGGVWLYLTHTHLLSLKAWAKTRDRFQMWASHLGQPSGGCLFEQRLQVLKEPQGPEEAAKTWRADECKTDLIYASRRGRKPCFLAHVIVRREARHSHTRQRLPSQD